MIFEQNLQTVRISLVDIPEIKAEKTVSSKPEAASIPGVLEGKPCGRGRFDETVKAEEGRKQEAEVLPSH